MGHELPITAEDWQSLEAHRKVHAASKPLFSMLRMERFLYSTLSTRTTRARIATCWVNTPTNNCATRIQLMATQCCTWLAKDEMPRWSACFARRVLLSTYKTWVSLRLLHSWFIYFKLPVHSVFFVLWSLFVFTHNYWAKFEVPCVRKLRNRPTPWYFPFVPWHFQTSVDSGESSRACEGTRWFLLFSRKRTHWE